MDLGSLAGLSLVEIRAPTMQIHGDIYQVPKTVLVLESCTGSHRFIEVTPEIVRVSKDDFLCLLSYEEVSAFEPQSMACVAEINEDSFGSNEVLGVEAFVDRRLIRSGGRFVGPMNAISALRFKLRKTPPLCIWHDQNQGEEELAIWYLDERLSARFGELELAPLHR